MNLVKNGKPTLSKFNNWGRINLPEVAKKKRIAKIIIINIKFL